MIGKDNEPRQPHGSNHQGIAWTRIHSWVFLAIVAVGLFGLVVQNRYHYLSPLGLGKAYRIDKVFGGIQEFDPSKGWIQAQLQGPPPQPSFSMMEPPSGPPGPSVPLNMPGGMPPAISLSPGGPPQISISDRPQPTPHIVTKDVPPPPAPAAPAQKEPVREPPKEMTDKEKLAAFNKSFPDFGQDEFQLANDDLYPHWKKSVAQNGTWNEFLGAYGDFVQWWNERGQPAEPGFKLWKDFLASKPRN